MGEHKKNPRPSTQGQHEKGQARVDRDKGGEKKDKRREYFGEFHFRPAVDPARFDDRGLLLDDASRREVHLQRTFGSRLGKRVRGHGVAVRPEACGVAAAV